MRVTALARRATVRFRGPEERSCAATASRTGSRSSYFVGIVDDATGTPPDGQFNAHLDAPSPGPSAKYPWRPNLLPQFTTISVCRDPRLPDSAVPGFVGVELDWARFSTTVRYSGNFTLPTDVPMLDVDTAALLTFNAGVVDAHGLSVTTYGSPNIMQ